MEPGAEAAVLVQLKVPQAEQAARGDQAPVPEKVLELRAVGQVLLGKSPGETEAMVNQGDIKVSYEPD